MLTLHIESISPSGWDLEESPDAESLPLLHALIREGHVCFTRPVQVRIHARLMGEHVLIDGIAKTAATLICSRCLANFELELDTDFSATAVPDKPSKATADREDVEIAADEIDVIPYQGENIDLHDEIAQQIIMALPFKPLCDEACKGLCSHCGANRNHTSCTCQADLASSPFAALKSLKLPADKE